MRRREFITGLGSAVAWPLVALAQRAAMRVVGVVSGQTADASISAVAAFRAGLRELGYVESENVSVELGMVGTSGAGDHVKIEGQAHATQAQIGYAQQPEMRCPLPQDRAAVPAAGDGERPLSHARRTIDGGAEG